MNYQHHYHAGNIADVLKHITLITLAEAMISKDKPFCYIESHAGMPYYDLKAEASQKTGEYKQGIAKIWQKTNLPEVITRYLQIIHKLQFSLTRNPDKTALRYYPGSSVIVQNYLRTHDRMCLNDLNPSVNGYLLRYFAKTACISISEQDGYQSLKAFLPPKEKRGLILVDPPYEDTQELASLPEKILNAYQRFATGTYAIWYPIKDQRRIQNFHNKLQTLKIPKILISELSFLPDDVPTRLNGTGMAIINPPWKIAETLRELNTVLLNYLGQHSKAKTKTYWLTEH